MFNKNLSTDVMNSAGDDSFKSVKIASTISALAGIWLVASPWIYDVYANKTAWNSWAVGAAIAFLGMICILRPARSVFFGCCGAVLGIWALCSPWVYGYAEADRGRFLNSVLVGSIVTVFSVVAMCQYQLKKNAHSSD